MNSYAILIDKKKMKNIGDKILLSLAKKNNVSKYQIYGNLIFLEFLFPLTGLTINNILFIFNYFIELHNKCPNLCIKFYLNGYFVIIISIPYF